MARKRGRLKAIRRGLGWLVKKRPKVRRAAKNVNKGLNWLTSTGRKAGRKGRKVVSAWDKYDAKSRKDFIKLMKRRHR